MSIRERNRILTEMTLLMLVFSIFCILSVISYALFYSFQKGNTQNFIEAGVIAFSYDEGESLSNGIKLTDAYPMADEVGKILSGSNQYFDFSVTSKTTLADVFYDIILVKDDESTLADEYVKIYLTKVNGNIEIPCDGFLDDDDNVKTFDQFNMYDNGDVSIYKDVVKKGNKNYSENFRLRMWMKDYEFSEDADIYDKFYSVKVKVDATQ